MKYLFQITNIQETFLDQQHEIPFPETFFSGSNTIFFQIQDKHLIDSHG
jgi:hypothetical protein